MSRPSGSQSGTCNGPRLGELTTHAPVVSSVRSVRTPPVSRSTTRMAAASGWPNSEYVTATRRPSGASPLLKTDPFTSCTVPVSHRGAGRSSPSDRSLTTANRPSGETSRPPPAARGPAPKAISDLAVGLRPEGPEPDDALVRRRHESSVGGERDFHQARLLPTQDDRAPCDQVPQQEAVREVTGGEEVPVRVEVHPVEPFDVVVEERQRVGGPRASRSKTCRERGGRAPPREQRRCIGRKGRGSGCVRPPGFAASAPGGQRPHPRRGLAGRVRGGDAVGRRPHAHAHLTLVPADDARGGLERIHAPPQDAAVLTVTSHSPGESSSPRGHRPSTRSGPPSIDHPRMTTGRSAGPALSTSKLRTCRPMRATSQPKDAGVQVSSRSRSGSDADVNLGVSSSVTDGSRRP